MKNRVHVVWTIIVGLAATLALTDRALAQEPMPPPPFPTPTRCRADLIAGTTSSCRTMAFPGRILTTTHRG